MLGSPVCIYLPPHNIKTYTISLYMSSTNVRNNLENIPFTLGNYGVTVAFCWCGSFIEFEDVLVDSGVIGPGCDEISARPRVKLWTSLVFMVTNKSVSILFTHRIENAPTIKHWSVRCDVIRPDIELKIAISLLFEQWIPGIFCGSSVTVMPNTGRFTLKQTKEYTSKPGGLFRSSTDSRSLFCRFFITTACGGVRL